MHGNVIEVGQFSREKSTENMHARVSSAAALSAATMEWSPIPNLLEAEGVPLVILMVMRLSHVCSHHLEMGCMLPEIREAATSLSLFVAFDDCMVGGWDVGVLHPLTFAVHIKFLTVSV